MANNTRKNSKSVPKSKLVGYQNKITVKAPLQTKSDDIRRIVGFLFEVGTMRKIARAHRQALLTNDLTDNISSHSYRVTMIGLFLASMEQADVSKVVTMCLFHDIAEARSNDHNWINKRYTKVFEEEILNDQFSGLPFGEKLHEIVHEYHERMTPESKIAKDADLIDQLLLLKEYELQGNAEAPTWLESKLDEKQNENVFFSETARKIVKELKTQSPSDWWKDIWTSKNR